MFVYLSVLVVNFTSNWAPQCVQVTEVLKVLSAEPENAGINFVSVDAETVAQLSKELKITSVPTVVLFRNAAEVSRICGVNVAEITKAVTNLHRAGHPVPNPAGTTDPSVDSNTRLKALVNRAPLMLFMKGNPSEPRCGFSRKILDILNSLKVSYDTFDILKDETVRQGLKSFSNWPTYPQLYVKGELVGGVDIVKEMAESGELAEALKT